MNEIQAGKYAARNVAATVYENDSGNLVLAIQHRLDDAPDVVLKSFHVLVKSDGTVNLKKIESLRKWAAGWDGTDPFWFVENNSANITGIPVELDVEMQPGYKDPSKLFPAVRWVNPAGGDGGGMHECISKNDLTTKYGARLRAAMGAMPKPIAARPAPHPAPQPATKSVPPPAPRQASLPQRNAAAKTPKETVNAAWELLLAGTPGMSQSDREKAWWGMMDKTAKGKDMDQYSPEETKALSEAVEAYIKDDSEAEAAPEDNVM